MRGRYVYRSDAVAQCIESVDIDTLGVYAHGNESGAARSEGSTRTRISRLLDCGPALARQQDARAEP